MLLHVCLFSNDVLLHEIHMFISLLFCGLTVTINIVTDALMSGRQQKADVYI